MWKKVSLLFTSKRNVPIDHPNAECLDAKISNLREFFDATLHSTVPYLPRYIGTYMKAKRIDRPLYTYRPTNRKI